MNDISHLLIRDPNHAFRIRVEGTALNNPENVFPPTKAGQARALKEAMRKDELMDRRTGGKVKVSSVHLTAPNGDFGQCIGFLAIRCADLGWIYLGPNPLEYARRGLKDSHANAHLSSERDAAYKARMIALGLA